MTIDHCIRVLYLEYLPCKWVIAMVMQQRIYNNFTTQFLVHLSSFWYTQARYHSHALFSGSQGRKYLYVQGSITCLLACKQV